MASEKGRKNESGCSLDLIHQAGESPSETNQHRLQIGESLPKLSSPQDSLVRQTHWFLFGLVGSSLISPTVVSSPPQTGHESFADRGKIDCPIASKSSRRVFIVAH